MKSAVFVITKSPEGWTITSNGYAILTCKRKRAAEMSVRAASLALGETPPNKARARFAVQRL
jgi:hypothetical protein